MDSTHKIINKSSFNMNEIENESIALVVTSPPYPMIEMWDAIFSNQDENIKILFENQDYDGAFNKIHDLLENIWREIDRVLTDGGIVCVNIGDATRNCSGVFKMFSNHTKIISFFMEIGYSVLPEIIWRKQSNSPNKFMGSGMYPPGAYVTYEHEYILVFRKGKERKFITEKDKINRQQSACFGEEQGIWFSDLWQLKGVSQNMSGSKNRNRSAAFPFELAYRLVNMFSVKGDTVLDPFIGTGTVSLASIASERNSIGYEIDNDVVDLAVSSIISSKDSINEYINERIKNHNQFISEQYKLSENKFYINDFHNFKVISEYEIRLCIREIDSIMQMGENIMCNYK